MADHLKRAPARAPLAAEAVDENTPSRSRFLALAMGGLAVCPVLQSCVFIDVADTGEGGGGAVTFSVNDPTYAPLAEVGKHVCTAFGPVQVILLRASESEILAF